MGREAFDVLIVERGRLPFDAFGDGDVRQYSTLSDVQQQGRETRRRFLVTDLLDGGRVAGGVGATRPAGFPIAKILRLGCRAGNWSTRFLRTNVTLKKENAGRFNPGLWVDRKGRQKDLASKASDP